MATKRIRYILRTFNKPFGGPQQIRHHVSMLLELGYDAAIVSDSDADDHFYDLKVPLILNKDFNPGLDDLCVVPEGWRGHFLALAETKATKICFCQNHFYLHKTFLGQEDFSTFGVETVMTCSRQIANHIERYHGIVDTHVIPCAVDVSGVEAVRNNLSVFLMPRKRELDASFIFDLFRRKHGNLRGVPWIVADRVSHKVAMQRMAGTGVFLSLSHREGLGLPPLEAMALGTLVVGFHGDGGLDYATARNGFWCEEGDFHACADAIARALSLLAGDRREAADMIAEGRRTATGYAPARMKDALDAFWRPRI